jgi:small ligand-binding sensory domain FIST
MKAASGLARGREPSPQLAAAAVAAALARAGRDRADRVVLFLTRDHARLAQPTLVAAARAAGCLEVAGCTAGGLFTEDGWVLDRPAAAALVIARDGAPAAGDGESPLLSFTGRAALPHEWQIAPARAGLLDADATVWAHGRLAADAGATLALPGVRTRLALSTGLRRLGEPHTVDAVAGYDLVRLGGQAASDSLRRCLPAELRADPPLHRIALVRQADMPAIAILATAGDGALTLSEPLTAGERVAWALRSPLGAEEDMRQSLVAVDPEKRPDFALMFSCLGRGPLFHGGDDRDLLVFRERFPATPLLGAYGSGQIAPSAGGNRLFHNSVVTLLCEDSHV